MLNIKNLQRRLFLRIYINTTLPRPKLKKYKESFKEKYEVNLVIENPLDNSLTASGMIVLKNEDNITISNDFFGIKPNQSGGLFKYIQAPLKPGSQIISAIITHPEGIYSITKKIKVGL